MTLSRPSQMPLLMPVLAAAAGFMTPAGTGGNRDPSSAGSDAGAFGGTPSDPSCESFIEAGVISLLRGQASNSHHFGPLATPLFPEFAAVARHTPQHTRKKPHAPTTKTAHAPRSMLSASSLSGA